MLGRVKWFDAYKGYGFIAGDDGEDYFAHFSEVKEERKRLFEAEEVEFEGERNNKGLHAVNITVKG